LNPDSYNPGKQNYHPIQDATWKKGENVPYMVLAKTLELVIKN
jgi:DNA ligase-1